MEGLPPTNHTPYLIAAYGLAFLFIFGFAVWLLRERRMLSSHLAVLDKDHLGNKSS
jgi:hypothetical protein